jgi:hypothetical protein
MRTDATARQQSGTRESTARHPAHGAGILEPDVRCPVAQKHGARFVRAPRREELVCNGLSNLPR